MALQPEDFVHANALDKSCNFNSMGQYDIVRCVSKTFLMESEKFKKNEKFLLDNADKKTLDVYKPYRDKWLKEGYSKCNALFLEDDGREKYINYIDCATKVLEDKNETLELKFICNGKLCDLENDE